MTLNVAVSDKAKGTATKEYVEARMVESTHRIIVKDAEEDWRAISSFKLGAYSTFVSTPPNGERPDPVDYAKDFNKLIENVPNAHILVVKEGIWGEGGQCDTPESKRIYLALNTSGNLVGTAVWAHEVGHAARICGHRGSSTDYLMENPGSQKWLSQKFDDEVYLFEHYRPN